MQWFNVVIQCSDFNAGMLSLEVSRKSQQEFQKMEFLSGCKSGIDDLGSCLNPRVYVSITSWWFGTWVFLLWNPTYINYTAPKDFDKFTGRCIRFLEIALDDHHGYATPNFFSKSSPNIIPFGNPSLTFISLLESLKEKLTASASTLQLSFTFIPLWVLHCGI